MTPSTDFYKKLALDCSGQQVAVEAYSFSVDSILIWLLWVGLPCDYFSGESQMEFYDDIDDKVKEFLSLGSQFSL